MRMLVISIVIACNSINPLFKLYFTRIILININININKITYLYLLNKHLIVTI